VPSKRSGWLMSYWALARSLKKSEVIARFRLNQFRVSAFLLNPASTARVSKGSRH